MVRHGETGVWWQVLDRRLRRIADEIRLGVADEMDKIAAQGLPATEETGWAQLTTAFPSADNMLDEIQVCPQTLPPELTLEAMMSIVIAPYWDCNTPAKTWNGFNNLLL